MCGAMRSFRRLPDVRRHSHPTTRNRSTILSDQIKGTLGYQEDAHLLYYMGFTVNHC